MMKTKIDALLQEYRTHEYRFKEIIERWRIRGKMNEYNQAQDAMASIAKQMGLYNAQSLGADDYMLKGIYKEIKSAYKILKEMTKPVWRQWVEALCIAFVLAFFVRNFIFGLYHVPTGSAEPNILVGDRIWGNKMAYFFNKPKRGDLVIFDNPEHMYTSSSGFGHWWQRYIGLPLPLLGVGAGPDNWVKRVIAIPGDTIEGRIEQGKTVLYRNGERLNEAYVNPYPLIKAKKTIGFFAGEHFGPFSIPSFLRYDERTVRYTFDPKLSLEAQPYYRLTEQEVVKNWSSGEYEFDEAFTPCYTYSSGALTSVDSFGPFKLPDGKYWVMGDSRKNSRDSRYWLFLDEKFIHGRASFVIYSVDSEESLWLFELIKHPIDFWAKKLRYNRFFKSLNGYEIKDK